MSVETIVDVETAIKDAFAPNWKVIVHNDDVNTFEHVIDCLIRVVGISEQDAMDHAVQIHTKGLSIVAMTTQEKAEFMHEQLLADKLNVTIEKDVI